MDSQSRPLTSWERLLKFVFSPRGLRDLLALVLIALVTFAAAVNLHLLDGFVAWYNHDPIDAVTEGLIILAPLVPIGLAFVAIQRWRELRHTLQLQNAREEAARALGEANQRRADQMSALNHMGQTVLASLDPRRVLNQVIAEVGTLFHGAAGISLMLREGDELVFSAVSGQANAGLLGHRFSIHSGISGWVVRNGRSLRVTDPESQGRFYRGLEQINGFHTQSMIAVPLRAGSETVGVLVAVSPQTDAFDDDDLHLLEGAGHWASIAIENARRSETEQSERTIAQTLVNISGVLNDSLEPDVVMDRIMESISSVTAYDQVTMRMINETLLQSVGVRHQNAANAVYAQPDPNLALDTLPLLKAALEQREPILVADTVTNAQWVRTPGNEWIRSCLIVPVDTHGILLGILTLKSATPGFYTPADARRAQSFAALAAATLERSLLYDILLQRSERLALVNRAGQLAHATLDLHTLLQSVAELLRQARRYPNLGILLVEGSDLVLHAVSGEMGDLPPIGYRQALDVGVMGYAYKQGKSYYVADMHNDPHYYTPTPQMSARSELAVPIRLGGVPLGIINIESERPNAFDDQDMLVVETIADQIAGAIHNAQLYREAQAHLSEVMVLHSASQDLNKTLDLDTTAQTVADYFQRALDLDTCTLLLLDSTRENFVTLYDTDPLDYANSPKGSVYPVSMLPYFEQVAHDTRVLVYQVEDADLPVHLRDEMVRLRWNSLMVVPLVHRDTSIGLIELGVRSGIHHFTPEQVRLAVSLSNQAAVAIENARLYQETRIQAEHLELALETEYKMRHQLVQADKLSALGRMVASIAHEVNNPLQSLQNCLYILSLPTTTPEKHDHYVTVALSEIDRLANLIVQLRSVYRPSLAHSSQFEPLGQMIEHVTSLVAPHLQRNRVQLEQDTLPPKLAALPVSESLRQVLINLALNAVDAMQPDGGTLSLQFGLGESEFEIVVQDSGRGIAPEALPHIFEPFYSTKEMGMGLGLAICYDIVYRNGGRIQVESLPDRGARFVIHLPLATLAEAQGQAVTA